MSIEEARGLSCSTEQLEFVFDLINWQSELNRKSSIDCMVYDVLDQVLESFVACCE